jgi:hypothetical protein
MGLALTYLANLWASLALGAVLLFCVGAIALICDYKKSIFFIK